ncbi:28738_t:CDS:2 [Racocetra persica]|uniref:28738_t:CDS:1 n=1 Tax=Racocetra persica TaxID=160502 RepID=A0ACA9PSK5_9GLOM|nr:28738_t:CDS:2 [Racocetra persica]
MSRFNLSCLVVFLVFISVVSAVTMNVTVGGSAGELTFTPQNITASKGDVIQFVWAGGQHSVILSDAAGACTPSTKVQGNATISTAKTNGTATYTMDGSAPKVWYYCGVNMHCAKGMWGIITLAGTDETKASSANRISGGVSFGILMVIGAAAFLF